MNRKAQMRIATRLLLSVLLFGQISNAQPKKPIDYFALSPQSLITWPFDEISGAETLDLAGLSEKDREAALARLRQLPKLSRLELRECDLTKIDETDPVPPKVNTVVITYCKVSQGTIRWLSKFPAGVTLVFGVCDVRGVEFNLGSFKWVSIDNCKVSRSAVLKLVEQMTQVTFKEVTLADDK